jgi:Tfp pilus tip-associated adhesin PilY1
VTETESNVCPSLGTELWAFMPRVQLPLVRKNLARVDGSVRVIDAFGDFGGTGQRSFRTILTFQTGSADRTIGAPGAVYALDVTDPANPTVVWEYTAPTSAPAATELGAGLAIAAGPVLVDNKPQNLVIAQTNNGGTGGTATVTTALSLETGVRQWKFGYVFPSPPRSDATALPLPSTGIPGGAVGVDVTRQGFMTDVVMGDLFGNIWRIDAATGASRTGATPLFSFSTNKKPIGAMPAIYSDGNRQFVVFGSGGYADPLLATWAAGTQSLISIPITAAGPFPLDESSAQLAFKENLTAGSRAFAQVLVVGNEVFLATDSADVNLATYGSTTGTSGRVVGYDLTTTNSTIVAVRGGASSLASQGTSLFSSSSDQQQEVSTGSNGSVGVSVDSGSLPKLERRLWLRTE